MAACSLHTEHFSCRLGYLVKNGNGIWKLVRFSILLSFQTKSICVSNWLHKGLVQRWYSGMFGVGTMHWVNSNSMHEVWKLNEDMLKQKYRMHNLYVKVYFHRFCAIERRFNNRNSDKGSKTTALSVGCSWWLGTVMQVFKQTDSNGVISTTE